jgi:hypothetical protein
MVAPGELFQPASQESRVGFPNRFGEGDETPLLIKFFEEIGGEAAVVSDVVDLRADCVGFAGRTLGRHIFELHGLWLGVDGSERRVAASRGMWGADVRTFAVGVRPECRVGHGADAFAV